MSGRAALQPAWAKLVAIAAVLVILVEGSGLRPEP
jgi:hypothetical protein